MPERATARSSWPGCGCAAPSPLTPTRARVLRGQIAHYKIPRYVKFVDAFPMTVTGKVQKFKMREATIERLGL